MNPRLAQRPIKDCTGFSRLFLLCHLILRKRGKHRGDDWKSSVSPPHFEKTRKTLSGCSVPKSLTSRLRLRCYSISISRRIYILAVCLFFAISSVCPLPVFYQTTANLYHSGPYYRKQFFKCLPVILKKIAVCFLNFLQRYNKYSSKPNFKQ